MSWLPLSGGLAAAPLECFVCAWRVLHRISAFTRKSDTREKDPRIRGDFLFELRERNVRSTVRADTNVKKENSMADKSIAQIKKEVAARQKFLAQLVSFAAKWIQVHGQTLREKVHDAHTSWEAKLDGFHGFWFRISTGHSMMGGNDLQIYSAAALNQGTKILDVYWQVGDEFQVRHFAPGLNWQEAMRKLMRRKSLLKKTEPKKSKKKEEQETRARLKEKERTALLKQAEKLGVPV